MEKKTFVLLMIGIIAGFVLLMWYIIPPDNDVIVLNKEGKQLMIGYLVGTSSSTTGISNGAYTLYFENSNYRFEKFSPPTVGN